MKVKTEVPIVETVHLKKYFSVGRDSALHAVDDVSMSVYAGKTLGVVGESGCGKSTLGRTILRLLEPTSGDIKYMGESTLHLKKSQMLSMHKNMQIIFQDPYSSLNPRMSVEELIAEYMIVAKMYNSKKEVLDETERLMEVVGLDRRLAASYPHELDGGRRQRIGVARALALKPKFIVCDEPVSALDVSIQAQILNLLMDLQAEMNLSYLFITHNLSVVKHISYEIMVMYMGQPVEYALTDELFTNPLHPYTKALLAALPVPDLSMRERLLSPIKGEITTPINPKSGCRFAARCEYTFGKCFEKDPELKDVGNGHKVACYLVNG